MQKTEDKVLWQFGEIPADAEVIEVKEDDVEEAEEVFEVCAMKKSDEGRFKDGNIDRTCG